MDYNATLFLRHGYLDDFLRYIFNGNGSVVEVNRTHPIGQYICSMRKYSDWPVKELKPPRNFEFCIKLSFPKNRSENRFVYFTQEDTMNINDVINTYFDIEFWMYYLHGKKMGIQQKEILESFIITRKLTSLSYNTEMLKKRGYREEIRNIEKGVEVLRKKAQYASGKIDSGIKEYKNDLIYNDLKIIHANCPNEG